MYTLPEIQNEILEVMSLQVLREIAQHLQSSVIYIYIYIYIIMADEQQIYSIKNNWYSAYGRLMIT